MRFDVSSYIEHEAATNKLVANQTAPGSQIRRTPLERSRTQKDRRWTSLSGGHLGSAGTLVSAHIRPQGLCIMLNDRRQHHQARWDARIVGRAARIPA